MKVNKITRENPLIPGVRKYGIPYRGEIHVVDPSKSTLNGVQMGGKTLRSSLLCITSIATFIYPSYVK